jgi:hypothetical protein
VLSRELDSVGDLQMVKIHLAVVGGAILAPPHALEQHADGAPLLHLLLAMGSWQVVAHRTSTPLTRPFPKPEFVWREPSLEARPLSMIAPVR